MACAGSPTGLSSAPCNVPGDLNAAGLEQRSTGSTDIAQMKKRSQGMIFHTFIKKYQKFITVPYTVLQSSSEGERRGAIICALEHYRSLPKR